MTNISVVVPIFNEEGNIAALHEEIKKVCEENSYVYEIIFVDDGSTDASAEIAKALSPLTYIRLRRNFGQTAAMDAGIKQAKNTYIITMDGDRQNDPADIPRLIRHLEENDLDVVSGWRKKRNDPFMKRFMSRGANFLRSILVKDNIHDSGCSLKVYRRECFEQISLYGEMHRFIPALLKIKGFSVGEVVVEHRPRISGVTKYNWKRTVKGFLDMGTVWFWEKYASRPLHLFGSIGLATLFLAFASGCYSVVTYFQRGKVSDTGWLIMTVFLIFTGLQFLIFGLLADLSSKNYRETTKDKAYGIKETIVNP